MTNHSAHSTTLRRSKAPRVLALGAATALLMTACAADPDEAERGNRPVSLPNLQLAAALQPFDACDDLLTHVKREAAERVGPYGLDGGGGLWHGPGIPVARTDFDDGFARFDEVGGAISDGTSAATPAAANESSGPGNVALSGTNVQEIGVDEPDIVKTDGDRIVAVVGDRLMVLTGAAEAAEVVGELTLPGWGAQLLVEGDTALVILAGSDVHMTDSFGPVEINPISAPSGTRLLEVDLSNPRRPHIAADVTADGQHVASRLIDGTARVVVRSAPKQLEFVYPSGPTAEDAASTANRDVIERSTVQDWLPTVRREGSTRSEQLVECAAMSHPKEFAGFSTVSVLTFGVGEGLRDLGAVGVLADAQHVYASSESLYVATADFVEPAVFEDDAAMSQIDEHYATDLHKFDISSDGPALYRASGEVQGHPLNQFSMSERDGVLRIATTVGSPWCCGTGPSSESFVTTFAERDGALSKLGEVGGLGKGERIYSVRFLDDVGYVVTFRQTDPLYVVDLRDPARPVTTGELKIPGYSAYLHPIGDGLLLGVGQDGTDDGMLTGSQVSLFDVSDPSDPQRLAMERLGDGNSPVEFDHHAFLWWAPEDLAVLPVQSWGPTGQFVGAVGLRVQDDTLRRVLELTNDDSNLRPRPEPVPETTTTTAPPTTAVPPTTEAPPTTEGPPTTIDGTTTTAPPTTTVAPPTTIFDESDRAAGVSVSESATVIAPEPWPEPMPEPMPPYDYREPILRSFVVGDLLYTLSADGLAVTWLPTLDKIAWIRF